MNFGPLPEDLSTVLQGVPWEEWFAWKPVKVHDKYVWLKTVYRRMPRLTWPRSTTARHNWEYGRDWEYGTILDVLQST